MVSQDQANRASKYRNQASHFCCLAFQDLPLHRVA